MAQLADWGSARRVGIDVETRDDSLKELGIGVRRGGYVVGISLSIEDGPTYYLPIRHQLGQNLPVDEVLRYMRDNAARFKGAYVGANLSYDLDYLWEEGIYSPNARYLDVQVADPLLGELELSYSLKNIATRWGLPGKDEAELERAAKAFGVHPKSGLWKLPPEYVGAYAEQDTKLPLELMRRMEKLLDEQDLGEVWQLESDVLPVLVKLRRRGVRIDVERLSRIREWSKLEEQKELDFIKRETGITLGLECAHRTSDILPILDQLGISAQRVVREVDKQTQKESEKTIIAVDAILFRAAKHPVTQAIQRARKLGKLRNTFAASIDRYMVNGRLHTTFNQVVREADFGKDSLEGGRFGRLSCKDPNLQQQPARDEFAKEWRSIYIPEEGSTWGCLDYSQQEPRWTTHWAAMLNLNGAEAAANEYRNNPKADNHDMMAKLTGLPRKAAKTIYLGLCYGQGGARLCEDLGLPVEHALSYQQDGRFQMEYLPDRWAAQFREKELASMGCVRFKNWPAAGPEGRNLLEQFNGNAPFIKELAKIASKKAEKVGFIKSASGRRMRFPYKLKNPRLPADHPDNMQTYDWTHKALNRLIQGSAADQTKRAMVLIDREMPKSFLQLQVHDEMDGSFGSTSEMKQMAGIMRDAWPNTLVPFRVDIEAGPSWGEIKEIE
ncbi:MAG: DNA polymerase [Nitrospira sp.]